MGGFAGGRLRAPGMKLFYSPVSPFVRKVMVAAHELGLSAAIETERVVVSPILPNPGLAQHNPLMKLPTLVTDDGLSLFGSSLICDFLERVDGRALLTPRSEGERLRAAQLHVLGDGMIEAGIAIREGLHRFGRYENDRWERGQRLKIEQGLDYLEREAGAFGDELNLGTITAAVALSWLRFRDFTATDDAARPALSAWHARFSERSSMRLTEPRTDDALAKLRP